jgi:hypothetical protein
VVSASPAGASSLWRPSITDRLGEGADTLLNLAHVLAAAGQVPEARAAAAQALDLYQRKGNPQQPGTRSDI